MRTVLLTALCAALCVLLQPADARPRHHIPDAGKMVGCSDPTMRPCGEGVNRKPIFSEEISRKWLRHRHFLRANRRKEITHHNTARPMSAGLARVMAEGAGRAVNWIKPRAWCGWFMRHEFGVANPAANVARWCAAACRRDRRVASPRRQNHWPHR
jgi:hypothetical protein